MEMRQLQEQIASLNRQMAGSKPQQADALAPHSAAIPPQRDGDLPAPATASGQEAARLAAGVAVAGSGAGYAESWDDMD
jgi:hypothetical protein